MVERSFPAGTPIPLAEIESQARQEVIERNADWGVTWVHSYIAGDRRKTFCVCDAPSPEAIRRTARITSLPVDRITEVHVLDPYSYRHVELSGSSAATQRSQTAEMQPMRAADKEG